MIKSDPLIKSAYGGFVSNFNISKAISYIKNKPLFRNIKPGGYSEITNLEYSKQSFLSHSSESDLVNEEIVLFRHSGHNRVFRTAVEIFKQSPFTGFGLKSFRIKCSVILIEDTRKNPIGRQKFSCGNHPHNYYLEILSEVGLIGLFLMIFFISILLKNSFEYLRKYNKDNNSDILLILPAAISFFIEIWPIKSTGSFFTTWNATFFWITAGILIAFTRKTNLKS